MFHYSENHEYTMKRLILDFQGETVLKIRRVINTFKYSYLKKKKKYSINRLVYQPREFSDKMNPSEQFGHFKELK